MAKILIKKGDKGTLVGLIQEKLKVQKTEFFGDKTYNAVVAFQKLKKLDIDGKVGDDTLTALGIENPEQYLSTDVSKISETVKASQNTLGSTKNVEINGVAVSELMLDKDEYFPASLDKVWLFLHHTAGSSDPYAVAKNWNNDTRGRIATEFIIGGKSTKGDSTNDGVILRCMPKGSWAYHLGDNGNKDLHPLSVGVEVCNYGWLTKGGYKKDGKWIVKNPNSFFNYVGGEVPADQVCDLGYDFRGSQYYHAYTDKQIESLKTLILLIAKTHPKIDIKKGMLEFLTKDPKTAFDFKQDAYSGKIKGILSHIHVRKDKTDMYPCPKLIKMLLSLG